MGLSSWQSMLRFLDSDAKDEFANVSNTCIAKGIAVAGATGKHAKNYGRDRINFVAYDLRKYHDIKPKAWHLHRPAFQQLLVNDDETLELRQFINKYQRNAAEAEEEVAEPVNIKKHGEHPGKEEANIKKRGRRSKKIRVDDDDAVSVKPKIVRRSSRASVNYDERNDDDDVDDEEDSKTKRRRNQQDDEDEDDVDEDDEFLDVPKTAKRRNQDSGVDEKALVVTSVRIHVLCTHDQSAGQEIYILLYGDNFVGEEVNFEIYSSVQKYVTITASMSELIDFVNDLEKRTLGKIDAFSDYSRYVSLDESLEHLYPLIEGKDDTTLVNAPILDKIMQLRTTICEEHAKRMQEAYDYFIDPANREAIRTHLLALEEEYGVLKDHYLFRCLHVDGLHSETQFGKHLAGKIVTKYLPTGQLQKPHLYYMRKWEQVQEYSEDYIRYDSCVYDIGGERDYAKYQPSQWKLISGAKGSKAENFYFAITHGRYNELKKPKGGKLILRLTPRPCTQTLDNSPLTMQPTLMEIPPLTIPPLPMEISLLANPPTAVIEMSHSIVENVTAPIVVPPPVAAPIFAPVGGPVVSESADPVVVLEKIPLMTDYDVPDGPWEPGKIYRFEFIGEVRLGVFIRAPDGTGLYVWCMGMKDDYQVDGGYATFKLFKSETCPVTSGGRKPKFSLPQKENQMTGFSNKLIDFCGKSFGSKEIMDLIESFYRVIRKGVLEFSSVETNDDIRGEILVRFFGIPNRIFSYPAKYVMGQLGKSATSNKKGTKDMHFLMKLLDMLMMSGSADQETMIYGFKLLRRFPPHQLIAYREQFEDLFRVMDANDKTGAIDNYPSRVQSVSIQENYVVADFPSGLGYDELLLDAEKLLKPYDDVFPDAQCAWEIPKKMPRKSFVFPRIEGIIPVGNQTSADQNPYDMVVIRLRKQDEPRCATPWQAQNLFRRLRAFEGDKDPSLSIPYASNKKGSFLHVFPVKPTELTVTDGVFIDGRHVRIPGLYDGDSRRDYFPCFHLPATVSQAKYEEFYYDSKEFGRCSAEFCFANCYSDKMHQAEWEQRFGTIYWCPGRNEYVNQVSSVSYSWLKTRLDSQLRPIYGQRYYLHELSIPTGLSGDSSQFQCYGVALNVDDDDWESFDPNVQILQNILKPLYDNWTFATVWSFPRVLRVMRRHPTYDGFAIPRHNSNGMFWIKNNFQKELNSIYMVTSDVGYHKLYVYQDSQKGYVMIDPPGPTGIQSETQKVFMGDDRYNDVHGQGQGAWNPFYDILGCHPNRLRIVQDPSVKLRHACFYGKSGRDTHKVPRVWIHHFCHAARTNHHAKDLSKQSSCLCCGSHMEIARLNYDGQFSDGVPNTKNYIEKMTEAGPIIGAYPFDNRNIVGDIFFQNPVQSLNYVVRQCRPAAGVAPGTLFVPGNPPPANLSALNEFPNMYKN
jgi:hypothetical protein